MNKTTGFSKTLMNKTTGFSSNIKRVKGRSDKFMVRIEEQKIGERNKPKPITAKGQNTSCPKVKIIKKKISKRMLNTPEASNTSLKNSPGKSEKKKKRKVRKESSIDSFDISRYEKKYKFDGKH